MTLPKRIGRRAFLARNAAALAATSALPGIASATTSTAFAPEALAETAAAAVPESLPAAAVSWQTATAADLAPLIGQRFRFRSAENGDHVLSLVEVVPSRSGDHRPAGLPRREGVIAVFAGPDSGPIIDAGASVHSVRHTRLGRAELFAVPVPRRDGSHRIEIVLN